jgi:gamma-glutamyltranspeptidase
MLFFFGRVLLCVQQLRGLELAHARHGRLPWRDVVEPTIKLARDGVPVDRHTARFIDGFFQHWDNYFAGDEKANKAASGLRKYLSPNGSTYLREGELLRNLPLAETLEAIAEDGADALYKGAIAENLVEDVRASGGILTTNDMESYRAVLRTPISASVFGDMNYTLVGVPPPSSGGAVIIGIARFLSGYLKPFASDGLSFHRMVEGMRHAFAIRMSMGDPAFSANLTKGAVEDLTTTGYIESLRQMTRDDTVLPLSLYGGPKWAQLHDDEGKKEAVDAHEGDRRQRIRRRLALEQEVSERNSLDQSRRRLVRPFGYLEDSGTSHLSVLDGDGNAVAITTSINNIFGSEVYSETTGVLLGNTMDDFGAPLQTSNKYGLKPSEANFIAPGKRVS